MASNAEVANLFAHHAPMTNRRVEAHETLRTVYAEIAVLVNEILPSSREGSLALTLLQQSSWAAHAALAIHEQHIPDKRV